MGGRVIKTTTRSTEMIDHRPLGPLCEGLGTDMLASGAKPVPPVAVYGNYSDASDVINRREWSVEPEIRFSKA